MSARVLRVASAAMRAKADAAVESAEGVEWYTADQAHAALVGTMSTSNRADAEHIAAWNPVVAHAVADWLDAEARIVEQATANHPGNAPFIPDPNALAVARVFMGGTPDTEVRDWLTSNDMRERVGEVLAEHWLLDAALAVVAGADNNQENAEAPHDHDCSLHTCWRKDYR